MVVVAERAALRRGGAEAPRTGASLGGAGIDNGGGGELAVVVVAEQTSRRQAPAPP